MTSPSAIHSYPGWDRGLAVGDWTPGTCWRVGRSRHSLALAGATVLGLAEAARVVGGQSWLSALDWARRWRHFRSQLPNNRTDWALNVAESAAPKAYEVGGRVGCLPIEHRRRSWIAAAVRTAWRRKRAVVTLTESLGQAGRSVSAVAAGILGAFVIPLGDIILGLIRIVGYRMKVPEVYSRAPSGIEPSATESGRE